MVEEKEIDLITSLHGLFQYRSPLCQASVLCSSVLASILQSSLLKLKRIRRGRRQGETERRDKGGQRIEGCLSLVSSPYPNNFFKAGNLSDSFILFVEIESKLIHIHSGFKYQYNFYLEIIKDLLKIKAI